MNTLGVVGSLLLTFCGIPEVIRTIRYKKCHIGWGFTLMWFIGEIFLLIYIIPKNDLPLMLNYIFNILLGIIVIYYKIKYK